MADSSNAFHDLTYRAAVCEGVSKPLTPRSPRARRRWAYLLQTTGISSSGPSSSKAARRPERRRLGKAVLEDVSKNRSLITREIYVAGTGLPYDYKPWSATVDKTSPLVRLGALTPRVFLGRHLQVSPRAFDALSGKKEHERARNDVVPRSIFKKLEGWISGPSAREIADIRNNFIAHAADGVHLGSAQFKGVKFSQIDDLQRAIVRVERVLTDHVLSIRIARDVVPLAAPGNFSGSRFALFSVGIRYDNAPALE